MLEDLQKVSVEKQQIQNEFTRRVQQLESTIVALQQLKVDGQGVLKEPKISLPTKFDGPREHFWGFINKVRLVIQMHLMLLRYYGRACRMRRDHRGLGLGSRRRRRI